MSFLPLSGAVLFVVVTCAPSRDENVKGNLCTVMYQKREQSA